MGRAGPLLAAMASLALTGHAIERGGRSEIPCAIDDAAVPAFTLEDVNENSPTHGSEVSVHDFLGEVLVIYWAVST